MHGLTEKMFTNDRVVCTTDRVMDRTDRVVRTNDRDNVKPSLSLSGAPNIKKRRMKKQQQMMPNKG